MTKGSKAAVDRLRRWWRDPVQFVRENFKVEPDEWQKDALRAYATNAPRLRLALQACAGPGKSAVLAWIGWHFLSTSYDGQTDTPHFPQGIAISISGDNLDKNLWKELSLWRDASDFLKDQFAWTATRIYHKEYPDRWRLDAATYARSATPDQQANVLSGLHSPWILYLMDEIGDMAPAVLNKANQGLLNSTTRFGRIIGAGNPTSNTGLLYHIVQNEPTQWTVVRITGDPDDPKRSPRIDLEETRRLIAQKGRDDPWVQAFILGMFPEGGINQLLTPDEVRTAMERTAREEDFAHAQRRLGIDVSRYGLDLTTIFPRQGCVAFMPVTMKHQRGSAASVNIATRVLDIKASWGSEVELFDDTVGWAHGAVDFCRVNGGNPMPVDFGSTAVSDPRYKNRRAEMWMRMAEWVRTVGCLPNIPRLLQELTSVTYAFKESKYILEGKDEIKKRLGFSLDYSDGLALTHAIPDQPAAAFQARMPHGRDQSSGTYKPHQRFARR